MAIWLGEHRAFAVERYLVNGCSIVKTQREFRQKFNIARNKSVPNRHTIKKWVDTFRSTGTTTKIPAVGRKRTARTPENMERVRKAVEQAPLTSLRRHSASLRLSLGSLHRVVTKDLGYHPYKLQVTQHLKGTDYALRKEFCERLLTMTWSDNVEIFFSDEAHFELNGSVNKQNMRYWSQDNPERFVTKQLHSAKVTVWCAISKKRIIGPFFFENENGRTVSVDANRYEDMLKSFFFLQMRQKRVRIRNTWFQQDGATPHTTNSVLDCLKKKFGERLISRRTDFVWPPRSPDLTPCDFFLWGYLKSKVYTTPVNDLLTLKQKITATINEIPQEMLTNVFENIFTRCHECVGNNGRHLNNVIFK